MLSIIVPVYNVKGYLLKCLDSINNQTYKDYEVIIVDDGSTDGSAELIDSFCYDKSKYRVFHKPNGGLMSAWVEGVKQSKGDYIGFVDSDDFIEPDMYSSMYDKAIQTQSDIIWCDFYYEEEVRTSAIQEGYYDHANIYKVHEHIFPVPGREVISNARWNKLFRREIIEENLRYCSSLSRTFEDRYIVPACVFSAKTFYYLRKPLYHYIKRTGSNSGMYKKNLMSEIKQMYEVQAEMLKDKGLFDAYQDIWEMVFLDYIRLYIGRNILKIKGFSMRLESARDLLSDDLVNFRIAKYGNVMATDGKLGRSVYWAYRLNSPFLLAVVCSIVK